MPRRLRRLLLAAAAILVLGLGAAGAGWYLAVDYLRAVGPLRNPTIVDLPRGAGVTAIASRLAAAGAIDHPLAFAALARAQAKDRALKAGEYELAPGMSPDDFAAQTGISAKKLRKKVSSPTG